MQAPAIDIQNAHLSFAGKVLFKNLNCRIPAGAWTCILGPSGVGKSSLLRLITGLAWSDQKTVLAGSIRASDGLPLAHRIAYMAQQDLLMPWLTVLENTLIGFKLRGQHAKKIKQAQDLLQQVGLKSVIHAPPSKLSGGMRQRVALVRTLLEDRPVVLMDEPFSALDAITRLRLQELAANLLKDRTVLLITHDPMEALRLGHYVHVLAGSPAQLGPDLILPGLPPRSLQDPNLLTLQASLLEQLAQAQEETLDV